MRFQSAMAAMATNQNHVAQFAQHMGWEPKRAEATLNAYATGAYFPDKTELRAMGVSESLQWAYMVALNAYHIKQLLASPENAARLYAIVPKATVDKWMVGSAMPSGRSRVKIENEFPGIDLFFGVPPECVYVYVPDNAKVRLDLRRNRLWLGTFIVTMIQIGENQFVVPLEAMQQGFVDAARDAGLFFVDHGDFMRAEPASKVYLYYAKP